MSLTLITPPAALAVSLADARLQCRRETDDTSIDALLVRYVNGAAAECEAITRCALMEQTWEQTLDAFPPTGDIRLLKPPVRSIVSVTYVDEAGAVQTLPNDAYVLDATGDGEVRAWWLIPAEGTTWPASREVINAVRIRMVCGLATTDATVPPAIGIWLLLTIAYLATQAEAMDTTGRVRELPERWHVRKLDPFIQYDL